VNQRERHKTAGVSRVPGTVLREEGVGFFGEMGRGIHNGGKGRRRRACAVWTQRDGRGGCPLAGRKHSRKKSRRNYQREPRKGR